MILYFADRDLNIIGNASTQLTSTYILTDDIKKEDVDAGVSSFEGKIIFAEEDRINVERLVRTGNVIFRYDPADYQSGYIADKTSRSSSVPITKRFVINAFRDVFTVVEVEIDTQEHTLYFYAEDAGLDLLNDIVGAYSNTDKTITTYVNATLEDTGFVLKNDISDEDAKTLSLGWSGSETIIARLQSIAEAFDYEFSFGFDIVGMSIAKRWVSFEKERGTDTNIPVRINGHVDNILVKQSIANLATALMPVGDDGLTLDGYNWSDEEGNYHTAGSYLVSEKALSEWGRSTFNNASASGHIYRVFNCDATTQVDLKDKALEELKKRVQPEINYDVDIAYLPEGVGIGDRIVVVDDNAELYISGRILKLDTSITQNYRKVTLGEWKTKAAGISAKVQELASAFSKLAKARTLYTWIAYAASINPVTDISISSEDRPYIGILPNQIKSIDEITQAELIQAKDLFNWSKISASEGIFVKLESSNGYIFKNRSGETLLKAVVYVGEYRITSIIQLQDILGSSAELIWSEKIGSGNYVDLQDSDPRFEGNTKFNLRISTANTQLADTNSYRARVSFVT